MSVLDKLLDTLENMEPAEYKWWHGDEAVAELAAQRGALEAARAILVRLQKRGGLGYDAHDDIAAALAKLDALK